jgi:hypothetical protein
LVYYIAAPIIIVIPLIVVGHIKGIAVIIKALKIILLLFFLVEYFRIFIIYFVLIWFKDLAPKTKSLFLWNIGLSCVA